MHALMEFQMSGPSGKQDIGLTSKTDYVVHFCEKKGHSDLELRGMIWSGKVHALMEFQRSGPFDKRDMGLTSKTD